MIPESRFLIPDRNQFEADVAQLAERVLGKDEVTSSILVIGSIRRSIARRLCGEVDKTATESRRHVERKI